MYSETLEALRANNRFQPCFYRDRCDCGRWYFTIVFPNRSIFSAQDMAFLAGLPGAHSFEIIEGQMAVNFKDR